MSATLGFIHHWLYNKILLLVEREHQLINESDLRFDNLGSELYESAQAMYGCPRNPQIPLETIIDQNQIHNWLQREITTAEVREATFIKDLIDTLGEDGQLCVNQIFFKHGQDCGTKAQEKFTTKIALNLYKIMQDYYLNGMPCDGGDEMIMCSDTAYSWLGDHRHQKENWQKANICFEIMQDAYQAWFTGFISAIHPKATFKITNEGGLSIYTIHIP